MESLGLLTILDGGWIFAAALLAVDHLPDTPSASLAMLLVLCCGVLLWNLYLRRSVAQHLTARDLSDQRLRKAQQLARLGHWWRYPDTDESFWSAETYRIFGYSPTSLVPSPNELLTRIHPDDRDSLVRALEYRAPGPMGLELRVLLDRGEVRHIGISCQLVHDRRQDRPMVMSTVQDITHRKHIEQDLQREKERAQVTLSAIGDAVITTDAQGRVEMLNPVAERYTGWRLDQARGLPLERIFRLVEEHNRRPIVDPVGRCLHQQRVIRSEEDCLLLNHHGEEFAIQESVAPIQGPGGESLGAVVVFRDVSLERSQNRTRSQEASQDPLTGLVNRQAFEAHLETVVSDSRDSNAEHALCYLDLDRFKEVNDTCGHAAGDELLRQLGHLLKKITRKHDTLGRLGGDEFGLLLEHCPLSQAQRTANTICQAVREFRFHWENHSFSVGVSIGLVAIDRYATGDFRELLRQADLACFRAKDGGRDRVHLLRPEATEPASLPASRWAARIRLGLAENRFELYCQEAMALAGNRQPGQRLLEVVLRLREDDTLIRPGAFLPTAERYRLTPRLDAWVLEHVLEHLASIDLEANALCLLNLSAQTLGEPGFVDRVADALADSGVAARQLGFEISETIAVSQLATVSQVTGELHNLGCRVVMDNFGSGLSSFGYLKTLPVDFLKLDPAMIRNLQDNPVQQSIVSAIGQISRVMEIPSIATGVEGPETLRLLSGLNLDYAQGYQLGHPQPLDTTLESWAVPTPSLPMIANDGYRRFSSPAAIRRSL